MDRLSLLAWIESKLGGGPRRWFDVIVVRNVGPLLTTHPLAGDRISNRGFNAIVFANAGEPTHFLKVRPEWHVGFESEASVTVRLAAQPRLNSLVPASQTFITGSARILALEFIEGRALDVVIRARRARSWYELAANVLRATAPLHEAIAELGSDGNTGASDGQSLQEDLDQLASLGLGAKSARELSARLQASILPVSPQHGDFWPRNVLGAATGWRVLDFETCGDAATPLFDVFHFIRGCGEAAGNGRGDWITRWIGAGKVAWPLSEEVRRAACGLELESIEAALVAYKVKFTAKLHRRGVARERLAVRLSELEALPRLMENGVVRRLLG